MSPAENATFTTGGRSYLLLFGALVFALSFLAAGWRRAEHSGFDAGAITFCVLACIAIAGAFALPNRKFTFDPLRRIVRWSSNSAFKHEGGEIAFERIRGVVLQTTTRDAAALYRAALETTDGLIPITLEYSGNQPEAQALAQKIRAALGLPAP